MLYSVTFFLLYFQGAAAQRRPAGQVLFGNTTAYQSANVRSAPTFANNPTGPRITLASNPKYVCGRVYLFVV